MTEEQLQFAPVRALGAQLRNGEITAPELLERVLRAIEATDGEVCAYTVVCAEGARREAEQAQSELGAGRDRGPLHGLPVSIKDLIDTKGVPTTYGSPIFERHIPGADATVVTRLREAGAVIVGKTNTHEFALGGITPPTRNPHDLGRIPGGSSGGSAAAIAAGSALLTVGSDTGGSIRIPASYCGVVGLKPSYGLISRAGVFPESWSLDHLGPITRYVEDAAVLLGPLAGRDPADHTTVRGEAPDYAAGLSEGVEGLHVGVPSNHFFDGLDAEVNTSVRAAIEQLVNLGMIVREVAFPKVDELLGAHTAIDLAEIAANHRRIHAEHAARYLPETRQLIEAGFFVPVCTYIDALRARPRLLNEVLEAMDGVDVLATPSQPIVAPEVGETAATINDEEEDLLLAMVRLLAPFNLLGLPALSLCCGYDSQRLPIGLQLVGKPYDERTVLRVAYSFEVSTPWRNHVGRGLR
jgi:aspartyl-tRNA(Asn)/glutamyl-tRNA(Gln) amidotransferase subunit A